MINTYTFIRDTFSLLFGNQYPVNPPRPRPLIPPPFAIIVVFFYIPFGFLCSHFTFSNLHISVSSTSIIAPSLSKSPMYPGALKIVTNLLLAKNS